MQEHVNIEEYFLVCREIEECIVSKRYFINNQYAFKKFVDYCYKNTLFRFMNDCMYDVMELYCYLSSIKSTIVYDNLFFNKLDCILKIMNLYNDVCFESFSKIVRSDFFKKICLFQFRSVTKIEKFDLIISQFEKYKVNYNVYEFSSLVFNGFIASEYKRLTFIEALKQDKLDLEVVEALANLNSRDYEDLILFKIANEGRLKFNLQTARALCDNLKILGSSKKNACEVYAERNDIVLNAEIFENEELLDYAFDTFFKNYIIVDAFGKLWGSKIN